MVVEGNQLVFKCEFKSNTEEDAARFQVSWYQEFPLKQLNQIETLKGKERVAKLLVNHNCSQASSIFRLGKTVCLNHFQFFTENERFIRFSLHIHSDVCFFLFIDSGIAANSDVR